MKTSLLSFVLVSCVFVSIYSFSAENGGDTKAGISVKGEGNETEFLVTGNIRSHLDSVGFQTKRVRTFKTPTGSEIKYWEKMETEISLEDKRTRKIYIDSLVEITDKNKVSNGTAYGVIIRDIDSIGDTKTEVFDSISLEELKSIASSSTVSASPVVENLLDVVEKAQRAINAKYPDESSVARKIATEELEKIARGDGTEEGKIAVVQAKYLNPGKRDINGPEKESTKDALIPSQGK